MDGGLFLPSPFISGSGARETVRGDPLNRGLLGRWTFEDGTGRDSSVWGSHATPENGASQAIGRYGKAASLSGPNFTSTQNFNAGVGPQFAGLQVPLTITARVFQSNSSGFQPILAQYRTFPNDLIFMLRIDNSELRYYCRTAGGIQGFGSSFVVPTNQWVFLAAVISGTIAAPTATIYINRTSQTGGLASMASSVALDVNTRIGSNDHTVLGTANEGFTGRIQDVGLWGRPLLARELDRLRDEPFAGTTSSGEQLFFAARSVTPITADLAATLADATLSATATTTIQANAAITLADATLSATAQVGEPEPDTGARGGDDAPARREDIDRLARRRRRQEAEQAARAARLRATLERAYRAATGEAVDEAQETLAEAVQIAPVEMRARIADVAPMLGTTQALAELRAILASMQTRRDMLAREDDELAFILSVL